MKTFLRILLFIFSVISARAIDVVASSFTDQAVTLPGGAYTLQFSVNWSCDVFPQESMAGHVELLDSLGTVVGSADAHIHQSGTTATSTLGSMTVVEGLMNIMCPDLSVGDGRFAGFWNISGVPPGNYTLRFWSYTTQTGFVPSSTVWTVAAFQSGSIPPPPNSPPTISWNNTPGSVASGANYTVSAHGHDADGNQTQVNVWKNGTPFAFAGGGNGTDGDSFNPSADAGPQTITYTAQAVDALGAISAMISQTVTINAPPPVNFTLATSAGAGGSVSPGGSYVSGSTAIVSAIADAAHDFAGWSGDASGFGNPVSVTMNADKVVQANFVLKSLSLATSSGGGGGVTPGGTYPFGTWVTVTATPDATHYFTGWAGDASGSVPNATIYIDAPKVVQALFAAKTGQSISFTPPGDHPNGSPLFPVAVAASSGLPVTITVLSGPATVTGMDVLVTGPGTVVLEATQAGDGVTLAASPVTQSFNITTPVVLKYHAAAARAVLQTATTTSAIPYVLNP